MDNTKPESKNLVATGNAVRDGNSAKGWFVGHFIDSAEGFRRTENVEVKWGIHPANQGKNVPDASESGTTLTLLISGFFLVRFPDIEKSVSLRKAGDYVMFAPGVMHVWRAIADSVVVTVRWPSVGRKKRDGL
jgi:hypothetical protein